MMKPQNIFHDIPSSLPEEAFANLLTGSYVRMERIVSRGHSSPDGFWYDQEQAEWIMLLRGQATLAFAEANEPIVLKPGDYLNIPAHCRHRVLRTDPEGDTVWLAVHYRTDTDF